MRLAAAPAALALILAIPVTAAARDCPGVDLLATPSTAHAVGDAVVCLIDSWRTGEGLAPLRRRAQLDLSSAFQSSDMVDHHYLAHRRKNGPTLLDRISATGYFEHAADGVYSENIEVVPDETASAQTLFDAWMSSPEHRANLGHPTFRDIGVGIAFAPPDPTFYRDYASAVVTTDFGERMLRARRAQHVLRCNRTAYRRAHPYCAHRRRV